MYRNRTFTKVNLYKTIKFQFFSVDGIFLITILHFNFEVSLFKIKRTGVRKLFRLELSEGGVKIFIFEIS